MANLYNVGDSVLCQKLGGQSGTKAISPEYSGVVKEVLPGGEKYVVLLKKGPAPQAIMQAPRAHFQGNVVKESEMQSA